MQNLYPIIRRKRHPLIMADAPPAVVGNVEPVKVNAETETEKNRNPEKSDAGKSEQETAV